jgi:putative transposase
MSEISGNHRKRCQRHKESFHAHYLTFSCFRRQPFFASPTACQWFLHTLDSDRRAAGFDLWAFVIMPEHVHLVISPGEQYSISRILWRIKKPFADRMLARVREEHPAFLSRMSTRRADRTVHRFWQPGGGYDHNLWTPSRFHEKIHYVHANPVRRQLVPRPEAWPWSSYRAWTNATAEPLALDLADIPTVASS